MDREYVCRLSFLTRVDSTDVTLILSRQPESSIVRVKVQQRRKRIYWKVIASVETPLSVGMAPIFGQSSLLCSSRTTQTYDSRLDTAYKRLIYCVRN